MTPSRLRYESMQQLYRAERERRETVRNSIAIPVTALAFAVFNLSTLAVNIDIERLSSPSGIGILLIVSVALPCILAAAVLIVRVERDYIYIGPPDFEEIIRLENELKKTGIGERDSVEKLYDLLAGSYDIVYTRYFAANEQAARDRTRGLRLIVISLALLGMALVLLPWQSQGA